ncbi:hypothetical protein LZU85_09545 [Vibrio sp. IRLE0018]|uniref:hypothetical protein n=1 Tax=Vibrio floridensis TaxID=2908007 RepID=UPI001F476015|nr:hypothetical protein [Vibrio floridensis]MCF8779045.1 hypothetical protein [Vibrio floridensis]
MTAHLKLLAKIALANWLVISLMVGFNLLSAMSALIASMVITVLIAQDRKEHDVEGKQLQWLRHSMIPFQQQQLKRSIDLSEIAVAELLTTINQCTSPLVSLNPPYSLNPTQIDEIQAHQNRLITLLQFADTCHQLQQGVLDLSEQYQHASPTLNEQQWQQHCVELQQRLNDIANRTENASSAWAEGGEVIVFHEQGK